MTDNAPKRRKLSVQILLTFALCFAIALVLWIFISSLVTGLVEEYCFYHDIDMSEDDWRGVDRTVLLSAFAFSALVFVLLFLALFGERLAYIKEIILGVESLRLGNDGHEVPLKGNNELTELAQSINYLTATRRQIKQSEKRINDEKEELIRTLSHDIRTPLTSVMSYTELLCASEELGEEDMRAYLALVKEKTESIKGLTEVLLDGGRRELEHFEDGRLLLNQLSAELEELLEDRFEVHINTEGLIAFSADLDTREMRRIFDNLISNVEKYADPGYPVELEIGSAEGLVIRQSNRILESPAVKESYNMGINSIRRIAYSYGGGVEVLQRDGIFEITVRLLKI